MLMFLKDSVRHLVLIKFYMYKTTTTPSLMIYNLYLSAAGQCFSNLLPSSDGYQETLSTINPKRTATDMASTASESTIVGNALISSSTAASNPKSPREAVIVYLDNYFDTLVTTIK